MMVIANDPVTDIPQKTHGTTGYHRGTHRRPLVSSLFCAITSMWKRMFITVTGIFCSTVLSPRRIPRPTHHSSDMRPMFVPVVLSAVTTERCRLKHVCRWYRTVTLATAVAYLEAGRGCVCVCVWSDSKACTVPAPMNADRLSNARCHFNVHSNFINPNHSNPSAPCEEDTRVARVSSAGIIRREERCQNGMISLQSLPIPP